MNRFLKTIFAPFLWVYVAFGVLWMFVCELVKPSERENYERDEP